MSSPAPLRHVREIVGVFVLAAITLLLLALLVIGRSRHFFDTRAELRVSFPAEHSAVVRAGVPVKLAGEVVGKVEQVEREKDLVRARLSVLASAREVLRADARANLRVPFAGLVGELGIELDAGSDHAPWPEGKEIKGEAEGDPAVKARETVEQVRDQVPAILARTQDILDKVDGLLGQVKEANTARHADQLVQSVDRLVRTIDREQTVAHAARLVSELEQLVKALRQGQGSAGRFLTDTQLYDRTAQLLGDLHGSWGKIDALVGASTRVAERAEELAAQAKGRAADIEALLGQTQLLVMQANRALDLVNEHWLIRGSVPEPGLPVPPAVLDGLAPAAEGRP